MKLVSSPQSKLQIKKKWQSDYPLLFLIWLLGAVGDRIWYWLDGSVPDWDSADYLNGAVNYWYALQNIDWLNVDWWRSFWLLSNKIPPLHYILTAPFIDSSFISADRPSLVMLFYSALLLVAVYGLGKTLFDSKIGIYGAIITQLLPGLYYYRLEFLLDYPLTAIVVFCFWLLTVWRFQPKPSWLSAIALGLVGGLSLLLKQTALFFLFIPLMWSVAFCLKQRCWRKLSQILSAIALTIAVCYPWYRTNWLLILTSSKRATVDSAIIEGDPSLGSIDAWTYYFKALPYLVSWLLLLVPAVGLLLYILSKLFDWQFYRPSASIYNNWTGCRWLLVYLVGGYLLSSFNINKDPRYILPLLPVLSLFIAGGFRAFIPKWQKLIASICLGLGFLVMLLNIFPLPGQSIASFLSPKLQHRPYMGQPYPNRDIVQTIVNTEPYLRHTLGVLPSTPAINQHNFSFYGALNNFQLVGRQVGVRKEEVTADTRSLDWFLTKTGDQGSIPEAQKIITDLVRNSPDFQLFQTWQNPDGSQSQLYRATTPSVVVSRSSNISSKVSLKRIEIPQQVQPNSKIPAKFVWEGNASDLASGLILLSWHPVNDDRELAWINDRAIAFGMLAQNLQQQDTTLQVVESPALLIPEIPSGEYQLQATYLNRQTLESYPLSLPNTTFVVTKEASQLDAPELDLVTQLRIIAPTMASSIQALETIFAQTARINQYDGKQDYLQQAQIALTYRIESNSGSSQQQQDWYYTIALSQVLQQDVAGAIANWNKITQLQSDNPYPLAYLAFVYLYDWQPKKAQKALEQAEQIQPGIPEVKTLRGVAAIMQGKFISAWKLLT